MQSVAATAGLGVNECNRQVVAAEKPGENPGCSGLPFNIVVRAPRRQTGGNRCRRLYRLLIESAGRFSMLAETGRADRPELTSRCRLLRHQPTERPQAGIDIAGGSRRHAGDNQGLRQARIVVGEAFLKPQPIRRLHRLEAQHQPVGQNSADFAGATIVANNGAIAVQTQ